MLNLSKRFALLAFLAGSAVLVAPPSARATFTLTLAGGGAGSQTIVDNGAGDLAPAVGAITFVGGQGTFSTAIEVGTSNSSAGTAPATLTIGNTNITGTAGTLTVTLEDNMFTAPSPSPVLVNTQAAITSAVPVGSSVVNQTYINGAFVNQASIGVLPADGTSVTTPFALPTSPYTLTSVFTITLSGGGTIVSSGQSQVQATPEPGTLAMAFSALSLFGLARLRRRKTA